MHEFCKEYVEKKYDIGIVTYLEVVDFSGASSNSAAIANDRHGMFHDNSDELNVVICNETFDVFHKNYDEEKTTISNERHNAS